MSKRVFTGKLEAQFNPFEDDYLAEILEAASLAWARMKQPSVSEIEDRITLRLAGRLANDPRFAELPYDIIPQCWLVGLNGERLGRLDLRFKHRHSQREYFAFEAKRLHVTYPAGRFSPEYRTYVGELGMMAFIDGQYSRGLLAGGMLGYVMDGMVEVAWSGIRERIDSQREPLKLSGSPRSARPVFMKVVADGLDGTHLGETDHDLGTHNLCLFHLLLPVKVNKAARVGSLRASEARASARRG